MQRDISTRKGENADYISVQMFPSISLKLHRLKEKKKYPDPFKKSRSPHGLILVSLLALYFFVLNLKFNIAPLTDVSLEG
jgi:hypothetical protein